MEGIFHCQKKIFLPFYPYRNIFCLYAQVMTNSRGVSKNYGYVCFSTYDQAQAAIDGMDNQLIGDQFITVTFAQTKSDSGGQKSRNISESSDEMVQVGWKSYTSVTLNSQMNVLAIINIA